MITARLNGTFTVMVSVQDRAEPAGIYPTLEEAQEAWRQAEKAWNNRRLTRRNRCAVCCEALVSVRVVLPLKELQQVTEAGTGYCLLKVPPTMQHLLDGQPSLQTILNGSAFGDTFATSIAANLPRRI